jgi:hypothetical protein
VSEEEEFWRWRFCDIGSEMESAVGAGVGQLDDGVPDFEA